MFLHRRLPIPALLATLAVLPWLAGCSDTIVFGAQREIDVAIALNEDVAEPVQVNIGLNSQIAALVPALGKKDENGGSTTASATTPPTAATQLQGEILRHFRPEGEAASIFSGFRYTSSTVLDPLKPKYDAEIRSQFASGAAAVLLASSPKAVNKVVDVAIDRDSSFMSPAIVAWRLNLQSQVDGLTAPKVAALYLNPPTTNPSIEAVLADVKGTQAAACDASDLCRRDMLRIRIQDLGTPADLQKWDTAFAN